MVDRTKPRALTLRQYVPWSVYDIINRRSCLHVDAWLVEDAAGVLYFVMRSAAAQQQLEARAYACRNVLGAWTLAEYANGPAALAMLDTCISRAIGTAWARRHAPWLEDVHRTQIVPTLRLPRDGFKAPYSIALHYVWSDANVCDPMRGLPNYHGMAAPAVPVAHREPGVKPWDARERSVLRTLDKLLK